MASILDKIACYDVFQMKISKNKLKLEITERCDNYNRINLTKKEALKMVAEITEMINQMKDPTQPAPQKKEPTT